jgi:hypothetical protein
LLGSRLHSLRYTKSLMQFPKITQTDDLSQSHAWYSTSKSDSLNQTCDRVEWSCSGPLVSLIFYFTRVCSPSWSKGRPSIPIWIYDDEQCWASIGPSQFAYNCLDCNVTSSIKTYVFGGDLLLLFSFSFLDDVSCWCGKSKCLDAE